MRYPFHGIFRDGQGNVIEDGTIVVYLAGTTTVATAYEDSTTVTASTSFTSDSVGHFVFYVDDTDYDYTQLYDVSLSKTGYNSQMYEDVVVFGAVTDALVAFSAITTNNASETKHGFLPMLSGTSTEYLNGEGTWSVIDFATGVSGELLDEDDFATNSATKAPTQQSAKAYIASQILDEDAFTTNSATKAPSQQSTKVYIDARLPAGSMVKWPTETAPAGWLVRDGASYLRADYAGLFAIIGTMYGAADATHFNVPSDLGLFERNWANGSTRDPDRAARTAPGTAGATITAGDHVGTEQDGQFKSHTHPINAVIGGGAMNWVGSGASFGTVTETNARGGNETRPINRAYLPIIKY